MTRIVFLDTETTSLRPDRRAWDIGLIVRDGGRDVEHQWFVGADDLDLGNADPFALKIGRFYERHPSYNDATGDPWAAELGHGEYSMLREVERLTRGAHLVGAVPNFDAEVLSKRMRKYGIAPSWHYHLQDIETLVVGYLRGQGKPAPELPFRSDDISRLIGVEPPGDDERHTALGDAGWARAVWDRVMSA